MNNKIKKLWFYIHDDYRNGPNIYSYNRPPLYLINIKNNNNYNENNSDINNENNSDINCDDDNYSDSDSYADDESFDIDFILPSNNKLRLYIVNEFPNYTPIWHMDIDYNKNNNDQYTNIYLKIFTQIHECMPFKLTGHTNSYKDIGYYPDVNDKYKNMNNIINDELIHEINSTSNDCGKYFFIVLDSNGYYYYNKLLTPIC